MSPSTLSPPCKDDDDDDGIDDRDDNDRVVSPHTLLPHWRQKTCEIVSG